MTASTHYLCRIHRFTHPWLDIFIFSRRRIDWKRLMIALDVGPPADFTDPDRSFLDNLPQPYRLIVSVLETEVFSATNSTTNRSAFFECID